MHDGEHSAGLVDVRGIVRSHAHVRRVVVELPKPFLAVEIDRTKIVLVMRIVIGVKLVECPERR